MAVRETVTKTRCCDICETVIPDRTFYRNDGSFQETHLSIGELDYCFRCAGKVFTVINHRLDIDLKEIDKASKYVKYGINVPGDLSFSDLGHTVTV